MSSNRTEFSNNSRQAAWIAIGQFFSAALGIVSPMILSRFFSKGDYGTYKQVMYVYSTLTVVFSFGIPRAYSFFIPRVSLGESRDVINKITRIFTTIGIFLFFIFFVGASFIARLLGNPDLTLAFKYFAPTPLFLLPVFGFDCIMASYKKAHIVALYSVLTRVFSLLCIVLPVICWNGTFIHAIIGFDIASFVSFVLAIILRNIPTRGITIEKTSVTIKEILVYSVPLMVASIWIMIFQSANQFFVSRYYGNEVFADFSNGFIDFPIVPMIIGSIATVLMPLFSGMVGKEDDRIKDVWLKVLTKSVKISYPVVIYSIVFSKLIMTCFYGNIYESSGSYFIVKNLENLFAIVPFYPILLAVGKTREYSNIHMFMAILIIPLEYLVVKMGLSAIWIGVVFLLCSILKIVLQFIIVSRTINLSFKDLLPLNSMLSILIISFCATIIPWILVHYLDADQFVLLGVSLFVFAICYLIICWLVHISYKDILADFIPKKCSWVINLVP